MIVRWPGKIQAGAVCAEPVVQTDIFGTLAEIVGHSLSEHTAEDSVSLLPLLKGKTLDSPLHRIIINQSGHGALAVGMGKWKLHLKDNRLYDLESDLKETTDRSASHPEVVQQIRGEFDEQMQKGRTR
jgi:arylsulfatase A-like enzyme